MSCYIPPSIQEAAITLFAFNPSKEILSAVVTIEGTFLAFLVPLSFDIVARISDRYKSELISTPLQQYLRTFRLAVLLVIGLFVATLLTFFDERILCIGVWKLGMFFSFGLLGAILIEVSKLAYRVRSILINSEFLYEHFLSEVESYVE